MKRTPTSRCAAHGLLALRVKRSKMQTILCSLDHTVLRLTHVDGEANMCRDTSSPMRWFLILLRVARPIRRDVFFFAYCDHELFLLCVHGGQVHGRFMWLD